MSEEMERLEIDGGVESSDDEDSLAEKIVKVINGMPDYQVRPARVAAELGISVNEACSELCGLMAAVGGGPGGASFHFVKVDGQDIMVFQFPPDFHARALRSQRKEDFWKTCRNAAGVCIRVLKVVTAFGLILSLLILCLAAICGLIAAMVALSRDGNNRGHRTLLMRQIRSLFYTIRQLLWFYAVFGPSSDEQDPVMREMAYDLSLVLSCCCGNPAGFFYWYRAAQLSRRRNRALRRWGGTMTPSDIPGVYLVREGSWNQPVSTPDENRGLLGVAVEFLFGPDPPSPDDPLDKWKLRAAVILSASRRSQDNSVRLLDLAPFVDYPSSVVTGTKQIMEQALMIVAHFNGVPKDKQATTEGNALETSFVFPELLAEGDFDQYVPTPSSDDGSFEAFLCKKQGQMPVRTTNDLPEYLQERRYAFTHLSATKLIHCSALGLLNFVGVIWLEQSVSAGGLIEVDPRSWFGHFLRFVFIPVLRFYAILFLLLPLLRMLFLMMLNETRNQRNQQRQELASSGQQP